MSDLTPFMQVEHLHMTFPGEGGGLEVLRDLNFSLAAQEFICVLGPSGSGKSTLLRLISGLLHPTRGQIRFAGGTPRLGLVFQNANLMPWRSVLHNITLPLELQGMAPDEAEQRALEQVQRVGLQGFEQAWPRDLSGGMAQRVALARALIQEPDLLLLDEPFGSLDALTRERMGAELLEMWQAQRQTVLMVTHSIGEALLLADRVLVLTPRPASVSLDMTVDLPRPRGEDVRYTPRFTELARTLRAAIG